MLSWTFKAISSAGIPTITENKDLLSCSHGLPEIHMMQLPVEHVTCGMFQIFHGGACVQVTGSREYQTKMGIFFSRTHQRVVQSEKQVNKNNGNR